MLKKRSPCSLQLYQTHNLYTDRCLNLFNVGLLWAEFFSWSLRNLLIKVLNHAAGPMSSWLSEWSHSHFICRYYCFIHCCQNRVMNSIFDSHNSIGNPFLYLSAKIFPVTWYWLGIVFTDCRPWEFFKGYPFDVLWIHIKRYLHWWLYQRWNHSKISLTE